jgi:1-acyl-sn-glycerol-3-phosphate acyltransferase
VAISSLLVVGSVVWVPLAFVWAWKRWEKIPREDKKRRAIYGALLLACIAMKAMGPHRYHKVGSLLRARHWSLWKSWLRFFAFEVVADSARAAKAMDRLNQDGQQSILAVSPHGLFPFALAFAALPEQASQAFGYFRPVAATATNLFPVVNTFLKWLRAVDAGRSSVNQALAEGHRIGLAPGGISEMFEGFPKPGTHPDEEYVIARHRGFLKLAVKHGIPVIPVYCFGASKLLKRLQLPDFVERISRILRISIVLVFGAFGLPIPYRQRLLYTVGEPIYPQYIKEGSAAPSETSLEFEQQVNDMQYEFCSSIANLFERHKESYGWEHKILKLI